MVYTIQYCGNKSKSYMTIVSYLRQFNTKHHNPYMELFFGSGMVFFNLVPLMPDSFKAVIVDNNAELINFWNVVRNNYKELENELKYRWVGYKNNEDLKDRTDPVGRAARFYIDITQRSSGRGALKPVKLRKHFDDLAYSLDKASASIICKDALKFLEQVLNWNDLPTSMFCDPPYIGTENVYTTADDTFDHKRLAQLLNQLVDRVHIAVTYGNHPLIYNLYPKDTWRHIPLEKSNRGTEEILIIPKRDRISTDLMLFVK